MYYMYHTIIVLKKEIRTFTDLSQQQIHQGKDQYF